MRLTHVALALAAAVAAPAQAAINYIESPASTQNAQMCLPPTFPVMEMARGWAATSFDNVTSEPKVGQVFWVSAHFGVTGNPCGGGAHVRPELRLPDGFELAITPETPVHCYTGPIGGQMQEYGANVCPQAPTDATVQGGFLFENLADPAGAFPVPSYSAFEIYVPVYATTKANVFGTDPVKHVTFVQHYASSVSGAFTSTIAPKVFKQLSSLEMAQAPHSNVTHNSAHIDVTLHNRYNAGTVYVDVGTNQAFNLYTLEASVPAANFTSPLNIDLFDLPADTVIFWRVRFIEPGSPPVITDGGTRSFRTLPPPRFEIVTTSTAGGSIVRSIDAADYAMGTEVQLFAQPAAGYVFERFLVDGAPVTTPSVTVVTDRAHSVHAVFAQAPAANDDDGDDNGNVGNDNGNVGSDNGNAGNVGNGNAGSDNGNAGNVGNGGDSDDNAGNDNGTHGPRGQISVGSDADVDASDAGAEDDEAAGCSSTKASDAAPFVGFALVALIRARRRR